MATTTTTKTTIPKATNGAGVKKAAPKGGRVGKKNNARTAMAKMQAYCAITLHPEMTTSANRKSQLKLTVTKYKDLSFKEQQQELGKKVCYSTELRASLCNDE
ncbi:unnamed protein product [Alternaria alternata]